MATNVHITPVDVMTFAEEHEDLCGTLDLATPEGYAQAHALLLASLGGAPETGDKKEREAVEYSVFLVSARENGVLVLTPVGSARGSVGKPPSDPAKFNDLQKLEIRAQVMARKAGKAGEPTQVMKLATTTVPSFAPTPAAAPVESAPETASE